MKKISLFFGIGLVLACAQEQEPKIVPSKAILHFEQIAYFRVQNGVSDSVPYQFKLTYTYDNGKPYRWIDLDSSGRILTDYIYVYDTAWVQTGARYIEPGQEEYAVERNRYENDSTLITEWLDSTGQVFYTMVDNLNAMGKTYTATFIGDTIHGRDSTFYTDEGWIKRVFFTNTKGKVFNDRSFEYDSVSDKVQWIRRKKIMGDTLQEMHYRTWLEKGKPWSGKYYPGIISTGETDENYIRFTANGNYAFFTRTKDWTHQIGYLAERKYGQWQTPEILSVLDTIYNGAISPDGKKILFCTNTGEENPVWLLLKEKGQWGEPLTLGISAGYFHWVSDTEIAYYVHDNKGDLASASLIGTTLNPNTDLAFFNTPDTEFSPYLDPDKRFVIFTRYVQGDDSQKGMFISRNTGTVSNIQWEDPVKLKLPYGWGAQVIGNLEALIYSDGSDLYQVRWEELGLPFEL